MNSISRPALAAGAWFARQQQVRLAQPYRGYEVGEQFVDIPGGLGPRAIGRLLVRDGIVRDELTWRLAVWRSGQATAPLAQAVKMIRPAGRVVTARLLRKEGPVPACVRSLRRRPGR